MTVCGLLRLDGADVRRAALTAMLASSSSGLPAVRGVHVDGSFGAASAAGMRADPTPPIAVDDAGLVVIMDGSPRRGQGGQTARALAAAYRAGGRWAMPRSAARALTVVWDPRRARLVLARSAGVMEELVISSDGRLFAFGTEAAQVLSVGALDTPHRLARVRRLGPGEAVEVTVPDRVRRPTLALLRPAGVESDVS